MTNVIQFWNQKRWEHLGKAFVLNYKMQDCDTYCLAAAIAYTAYLCHEALENVYGSKS